MASLQTHKPSDPDSAKKEERFEARITTYQKALFQKAASITGQPIGSFVITSAQEKAVTTVRDHETMTLTAREAEAFVHALREPPEPVERLRKAARRRKERFVG